MAAFVGVARGRPAGDPGTSFPTGDALLAASGAAFTAVVLGQAANAFACRSATVPPWRLGWFSNRLLVWAVLAELGLLAVFLFLGPLAAVLGHAPPSPGGLAVALAAISGGAARGLAVQDCAPPPGRDCRPGHKGPKTLDPECTGVPPQDGCMADSPVLWFEEVGMADVPQVGGKNASLGEMIRHLAEGVRVPDGFATTADAYRRFLAANGIEAAMRARLQALPARAKRRCAGRRRGHPPAVPGRRVPGRTSPERSARAYRDAVRRARGVRTRPRSRCAAAPPPRTCPTRASPASRRPSSTSAASATLLDACRRCYASLFTDRAISYREAKGFDHIKVALSIGVQRMVRSDLGGSGVMFSIDTETGFPGVASSTPPGASARTSSRARSIPTSTSSSSRSSTDAALRPIIEKTLGAKERKMVYADGRRARRPRSSPTSRRRARAPSSWPTPRSSRWRAGPCAIEEHYGRPMDMEWAKDGETGELFIVQARPETVQSRSRLRGAPTYAAARDGHGARRRAPRSARRSSPGAVCVIRERRATSTASATARCWSPR